MKSPITCTKLRLKCKRCIHDCIRACSIGEPCEYPSDTCKSEDGVNVKRVGRYKLKRVGKPPVYNHAKIELLILRGLDNHEISNLVGCDSNYVGELRRVFRKGGY